MSEPREEMWIIQSPHYGLRDIGRPCLWFEVATEGSPSGQAFFQSRADEIIKEADVSDIGHLHGKPCIVRVQGIHVEFVRMAKI